MRTLMVLLEMVDRWIAQACNCTCKRLVLVHCVGNESIAALKR